MTLPRSYSQFAVYETFAPTTLRGKVVMVAASDVVWLTDLPPILAMECARLGAHLALVAPDSAVYQPVSRDITSYGRPVLEVAAETPDVDHDTFAKQAVAAILERYGHIDLLVTAGATGYAELTLATCDAMAAAGSGCVVAVAPPAVAAPLQAQVTALHRKYCASGVRVNGISAPAAVADPGGPSAQEVAWQAIFLASQAGVSISGQCLEPAVVAEPAG